LKGSTSVRLELRNSRYLDRELKEHLSELILYSKYAGINLEGFHESIANAKLDPGQEGLDMRSGGRLTLETTYKTATLINQLVQMYPVFSTWDIKISEARKSSVATKNRKKENVMPTKKPAKKAVKKAAAKPAKKAAAKPAKKAAKKAAKKK
jgi:hypothetical protein